MDVNLNEKIMMRTHIGSRTRVQIRTRVGRGIFVCACADLGSSAAYHAIAAITDCS